jgi:hypothetical protein
VGEAIRIGGDADVAIDITEFEGFAHPVGPITREDLFVMYPRILEFEQRYGYTIWNVTMKGFILKFALKESVDLGMPINPAGMTPVLDADGNIKDFLIDGEPIVSMRDYKVAVPEAVARGALGTSKYLGLAFRNAHDTGLPIWKATEQHLQRIGGVIKGRAH